MTQEIEIEYKNIVTKSDFKKLLNAFSIEEAQFKKQINHYFDTKDFQLKKHHSALRIREKNNQYTLTLKQPNQIGLLETHQLLSTEEAVGALKGEPLPTGEIFNQVSKSFDINLLDCQLLGTLSTKRAEIPYFGGTLVFDHSYYLGVEDFEIEYEVTDEQQGKIYFKNLMSQYEIPLLKTENKIKRFFLRKQQ